MKYLDLGFKESYFVACFEVLDVDCSLVYGRAWEGADYLALGRAWEGVAPLFFGELGME